MLSSLQLIANDLKIQVEFNPERVHAYRLVGYENRALQDDEFRDDTVDAGEVGAGHRVTALYDLALTPKQLPEGARLDNGTDSDLEPAAAASDLVRVDREGVRTRRAGGRRQRAAVSIGSASRGDAPPT